MPETVYDYIRLIVLVFNIGLNINGIYAVSCPSGDVTGVVKNGQTCLQLLTSSHRECYNSTTETNCCASCNSITTSNPACRYGDRTLGCMSFLCPSMVDPATDCCATCVSFVTTTTTTTTTAPAPTTASTAAELTTENVTTISAPNDTTEIPSTAQKSSLSDAAIAGAVVGSLAGAAAVGAAVLLAAWLYKKNQNTIGDDSGNVKKKQTGSHELTDQYNGEIPEIKSNGYVIESAPSGTAFVTEIAQMGAVTTTTMTSSKAGDNAVHDIQASKRSNVHLEPIQSAPKTEVIVAHAPCIAPNPLPPISTNAGI